MPDLAQGFFKNLESEFALCSAGISAKRKDLKIK